MKFILIYTTYKDIEEAQKAVDYLLGNKIIACANFFSSMSKYRWKGTIENSNEITAILKTKIDNWDKVKEYIEAGHSYEIPCIIKLAEVESNDSYANWIQEETNYEMN